MREYHLLVKRLNEIYALRKNYSLSTPGPRPRVQSDQVLALLELLVEEANADS